MDPSAPRALAVELHPHSPTQWVATYYPMVHTPSGRWADVTWALHQRCMPPAPELAAAARWMEARGSDPDDPCYANHPAWSEALAAGYAAALAVLAAEAVEETSSLENPDQLRQASIVVPAGQLAEWVLDDLEDEAAQVRG
ncbi:hypothetical protein GMA12_16695 [Kocuria sediminis]|uniref:Uncharacterized protein n=1 Tax=Kocuria sediminis TaxID=1038857 RepID=A0A6N8GPC2_9MICC|nr:hypothetical protein [Kocuria sediminis]MUN64758.1 hypothetical protein [Kocuria sediminis]